MGSCAVSTLGWEVRARGFGVAVGTSVGSGVMEGGCADSTFLCACTSLPVMSESLTFAALVRGSCGEVLCRFPVLSKDGDTVFEEYLRFLFVLEGDDT